MVPGLTCALHHPPLKVQTSGAGLNFRGTESQTTGSPQMRGALTRVSELSFQNQELSGEFYCVVKICAICKITLACMLGNEDHTF